MKKNGHIASTLTLKASNKKNCLTMKYAKHLSGYFYLKMSILGSKIY
jgi:hypothetical protein